MKRIFCPLLTLSLLVGSAFAQGEIKLGSHLPLTGALARIGNEMADGIRLAVEHFNEDNPDLRAEVIIEDDESSPGKAVGAMELLIGREDVLGVTGGYGSNIVGPASEVAERNEVPYITSGALATALTERGFDYFFRFSNQEGYTIVADLIKEGFGAEKVALLYDSGQGGTDVGRAVKERLEGNELDIVFEASYPGDSTDLKPLLERVSRADADVLMFIGYENNNATVLRNAQAVAPDIDAFVGLYSLVTPSLMGDLGELMNGVYGTEPWSPGTAPEALREDETRFIESYSEVYGEEPGYLAALGYAQTLFMLEAAKEAAAAGDLTSNTLRDAMANLTLDTIVASVDFDEVGENVVYQTIVSQVQDGAAVPVWPPDRATGDLVYPLVGW